MSGIQTLLLTDVVDSTQLNDSCGDEAMGKLWAEHDAAARQLMTVWHGQELARSDGFLVIFADSLDAVHFACDYHQALRTLDARMEARVGIHAGTVTIRPNSDADRARGAPQYELDGAALPIASRVMAIALGGQTLISAVTLHSLGEIPLSLLQIRGHGHWRLKGIAQPVELFEIGDASARLQPPPDSAKAYRVIHHGSEWTPARTIANNLPAQRDAFVGRTEELRSLATLCEGLSRLVTLLGIGGIGKTRLALQYARASIGDFPGGVWFCDLSTARGLDGMVSAVGSALNVPLGKGEPVQQIGAAIAARGPCLVILDTFEQVARHAEATLGVWLESAAEARFLVTSREVLGINGEQTLAVAPLNSDQACKLFHHRAAATNTRVSGGDEPLVLRLVQLLDGLPLAIELAAARSRMMSPAMLLERMSTRFTLLASRGGRLSRQVTLRATLDWSWDLLSPQEKAALAQLSVFEGGFTLAAVESVLMIVDDDHGVVPLDGLQSLLDKSFVRQTGDDRFGLLQSVQEYAAEHLRCPGRFEGSGRDAALAAEVRHGSFYGQLSERQITDTGCVELDNIVSACRRAIGRGDSAGACQTLVLAWAALELRGPFRAGVDLAAQVLTIPRLAPSLAASVHLIHGRALRALGRVVKAAESFNEALSLARSTDDRRSESRTLSNMGTLAANAGRLDAARGHFLMGLDLAKQTNDAAIQCEIENGMGTLAGYAGDVGAALAHYERALGLARSIGSVRWEGGILGNIGNTHYSSGRISDARRSYEQGLTAAVQIGNRQWEANSMCNIGLMRHLEGATEAAKPILEQSLRIARELGHARLEAIALCNLGIVYEMSDPQVAETHFRLSLQVAETFADRRSQGQTLAFLGLLVTSRDRASEGRDLLDQSRIYLDGAGDDADRALLLCKSAQAYLLTASELKAKSEFERALEVADRVGPNLPVELKTALDSFRHRLEELAISWAEPLSAAPDASNAASTIPQAPRVVGGQPRSNMLD